jgi:tetratricopeptide (TPR) repeat protein
MFAVIGFCAHQSNEYITYQIHINLHRKVYIMKKILIGLSATTVAIMFFGIQAFAAGSSPKPASDARPGVSEYNSGVKLMKDGKYNKAEKKFKAAVKKNPNMAEAHNNLGYSLRKQGSKKYEEALFHYNQAIELNSDLAEAYMYRGVLYMLMGDEQKALADHQQLTRLNRGLADALQAAIASGEEPEGLDGLAKAW